MSKRTVVALGGNAIQKKGDQGTYQDQKENVKKTIKKLIPLLEEKQEVVLTHGNGPQVGSILLQNDAGKDTTPPMPMFVCGAMSQGQIGFLLQNNIKNFCLNKNFEQKIETILTQVEVDAKDPAFNEPTKPVGPFYTKEEAKKISKKKDYVTKEDAGRGFRRVVPSPKPQAIVEIASIKNALQSGSLVICAGGGGVPVIKNENSYQGVDAVIDKDHATSLLADELNADQLIILTAVDKVAINFGTKDQQWLDQLSIEETIQYLQDGHFAPGSMKPKVEAIISFLEKNQDKKALITSPNKLPEALEKRNGTWFSY